VTFPLVARWDQRVVDQAASCSRFNASATRGRSRLSGSPTGITTLLAELVDVAAAPGREREQVLEREVDSGGRRDGALHALRLVRGSATNEKATAVPGSS